MICIDVWDHETQVQKDKKKRMREAISHKEFWEATNSTLNYLYYSAIIGASVTSLSNFTSLDSWSESIGLALGVSVPAVFILLALARMAGDYQLEMARKKQYNVVSLTETNRIEPVISFSPRLFEFSADLLLAGFSVLGISNASSSLIIAATLSLSASVLMKCLEKENTEVTFYCQSESFFFLFPVLWARLSALR